MSKGFLNILFLLLLSNFIMANSITQKADELYAQNQYEQAAEAYRDLLKRGYEHSDIHYNLGDCYYRLNQIGPSILHFEKAIKINPANEDAQFNLKIANLKVASKVAPMADFILIKWWKNCTHIFSFNTWANIQIGWIWLALMGILLYLFGRSVSMKKVGFYTACLAFVFSLMSYVLGYSQKNSMQSSDYAIVMKTSYNAKSEPTDNGKDLFVLKEGMKIKKLDVVGKWHQIQLSDGNKGWIESEVMEGI